MSILWEQEPGDEPREASWEDRGRAAKVARFVEHLDARARAKGQCPTGDAELISRELRNLTTAEWHKLQHEVGFHRRTPPSVTTRNAVIETYEKRVDQQVFAESSFGPTEEELREQERRRR